MNLTIVFILFPLSTLGHFSDQNPLQNHIRSFLGQFDSENARWPTVGPGLRGALGVVLSEARACSSETIPKVNLGHLKWLKSV